MGRRPRKPHHAPPFVPTYASGGGEETLPIPGYRQARSYSCGFATALMVVRYFQPEIEARTLYRQLGTGRDGTRQSAIVKALRASGLGANVRYDVSFDRLQREIGRGKPVVGYLHDSEHWVLLYGYGLEPARVFVADPEPGEACVHGWERYAERLRRFGIVCSSRLRARAPAIALRERHPAAAEAPIVAREPRRPSPAPVQLSFAFGRGGR